MSDDQKLTQAVARAMSAWNLTPHSITLFSRSENVVFRAETASGVFAVRLHRPGYHSLEELNSEIIWQEMMSGAGLETPLAIKTVNGDHYVQMDMPGSDEKRYVGVTRWMSGTVLQDLIETTTDEEAKRGHFQQLGRLMATMHHHASQWTPPPRFFRHALDVDGFVGPEPFWGRFWETTSASPEQTATLEQARDKLRAFLSSLDQGHRWYGMIHADLHAGNIMVDKDHVVVFDFDDAGFGWYLYDIATALFEAWWDDEDYPATYEALIEGYTDVRPLTDEMLAMIPKFLMARMLAYIGWFNDRPENEDANLLTELIELACERSSAILG